MNWRQMMPTWQVLDRLTHACMLLLAVVLASGCAGPDGKNKNGVDKIVAGCTDDTADWFLRCPNDVVVEPGQDLFLEIERVDAQVDELFLWLVDVDGEVAFKIPTKEAIDGEAEDTWKLTIPLPPLPAGVWRVAVGSAILPFSNNVGFEVYYPEPLMSRADARAAYLGGLVEVTAIVDRLLAFDDPDWQLLMEDTLSPSDRAFITELTGLLQEAVDEGALRYDELGPEQELMVRAYLENTGFLEIMQGFADNPDWLSDVRTPIAITDATPPIQMLLFLTDMTGMMLETLGLITSVLTYASVVPGVGTVVGSIGFAADVVLAIVKLVIDTFIPSDLMGIELHATTWTPVLGEANTYMYEGEAVGAVYWGRFSPQNGASGAMQGLDGLIATVISELLPVGEGGEGVVEGLMEAGLDILVNWNVTVFTKIADKLAVDTNATVGVIYTPVDLRVYSPTGVAQGVLNAIPGAGGSTSPVSRLMSVLVSSLVDPPLEAVSSYPAGAADNVDMPLGNPFLMVVSGMNYPGPNPTDFATMDFKMNGWRFSSKDIEIWGMKVLTSPLLTRVDAADSLRIQPLADPNNENQLQADEAYVHASLPETGILGVTLAVTPFHSADRTYPMGLTSGGGFADPNPMIRIKVNGATVVDPAVIFFNVQQRFEIPLAPGRNTVEVEAITDPLGLCTTGSVTGSGCLIVEFSEARNVDKATTVVFGDLPSRSRSFVVWTPPLAQ